MSKYGDEIMFKKIFILLLCCCQLVSCGVVSNMINDDKYRPWYNEGTCLSLKGNPYVLFLFIDDDESSWTPEAISEFWYDRVEVALGYLENKASVYGVDLQFEKGYYSTDESKETTVKYNGVIVDNLMEKPISRDIFEQAATSLGFESKNALHNYIKDFSGKDQVAICLVVNKPGRSYCMNQSQNDGFRFVEYCVLYTEWLDNLGKCYPSSIAHEILHLFGAEDYYDPYGEYPKRAELAKQLYPNDIMNVALENIYDIEFGAYTAYTVGWLDALPTECDVDDWWN